MNKIYELFDLLSKVANIVIHSDKECAIINDIYEVKQDDSEKLVITKNGDLEAENMSPSQTSKFIKIDLGIEEGSIRKLSKGTIIINNSLGFTKEIISQNSSYKDIVKDIDSVAVRQCETVKKKTLGTIKKKRKFDLDEFDFEEED